MKGELLQEGGISLKTECSDLSRLSLNILLGKDFTAAGLAAHLFLLTAKQMVLPLKMFFVSPILVGNVKWTWILCEGGGIAFNKNH